MTRGRDMSMASAVAITALGFLLIAATTYAQAPQAPVLRTLPPPMTVTDPRDASEPGPSGVALSVVGRTVGVPAVLHAARGTARAPLAAVLVENPGAQAISGVALAVTWVPPDGSTRRRVVQVPAPIAPGATARVSLREIAALQALVGATGILEVALAGVTAVDGRHVRGAPERVWATGQTAIACADAQWQAHATDTDLADQATGRLVRCAADGQWRALDGADAEREQ